MVGFGSRLFESFKNAIDSVFTETSEAIDSLGMWEQIFELSTTTPAPEVDAVFATPSSSLWETLYTYNDALSVVALIYLFIIVALILFGNSIGGISGYDKKEGLYGSFLAAFLIVFNKEIMGMGLNASAALSTAIAPTAAEANLLYSEIQVLGLVPLVGTGFSFVFYTMQVIALVLVMFRDIMIFVLFIAMPILLAFRPLNIGALEKLGRIANGGIGTFGGALAFTLPVALAWRIGIIVQNTEYFAVLGNVSQAIFAGLVITGGTFFGLKATRMGNTVYTKSVGGAKSAAMKTGEVAAAYGTGGASTAAAAVIKGGSKRKGEAALERKDELGMARNKLRKRVGTSEPNGPVPGAPGTAMSGGNGIADFIDADEADEEPSNPSRRVQASNWMSERYENGKSYMRQTAASTPTIGGGTSISNTDSGSSDSVEFLYESYDQTNVASGNESATASTNQHSRGTDARVVKTNAPKVAPTPDSTPAASSLSDSQLEEITSDGQQDGTPVKNPSDYNDSNSSSSSGSDTSSNSTSSETSTSGVIEDSFPSNK